MGMLETVSRHDPVQLSGTAVRKKLDWYVLGRTQLSESPDSLTEVKPTEKMKARATFSKHTCSSFFLVMQADFITLVVWKHLDLSPEHFWAEIKDEHWLSLSRFDQLSNQWSTPCDGGPAWAQLQKIKPAKCFCLFHSL